MSDKHRSHKSRKHHHSEESCPSPKPVRYDCQPVGGCESRATVEPCANVGVFLRSYGASWATDPAIVQHCTLFDQNTQLVGLIDDFPQNNGTEIVHRWFLFDGSTLQVTLTADASYALFQPIDAQAVRSFPLTAPYEGNPNFRIFFAIDSHNNTDPVVLNWVSTGPNQVFAQARYYEARCAFLQKLNEGGNPANPTDWTIVQCMGCHYFISKQFGNVALPL
jgi:hypothetical protein